MEVLGAVSSAVALAEIFAKSVLTTKKLWDEAQDILEEINRLMKDLTHLKPMLEEAEAVFNNQAQNPSTDTALLLMHHYKEVSGKLHLLAADLNQRIATAKRGKRNLTKLKATLSKTLIRRYHKEMDSISQTLSFFFNCFKCGYNFHAWDFEAYSSPMGWNMSIRPWTTRPNGDQIFDLVKKGSWPEIAEQLNSGRASISDRNELGHSLLDIALRDAHFAVARSLVDLGFEIEGSGLLDSIETTWYLRSLLRYIDDALEWFEFAAEFGLLENLSEKIFGPTRTRGLKFSVVCRYVWTIPGLLSLFVGERTAIHGEVSISELFRNIRWYQTDPRLFLELCHNKRVHSQFFRESVMKVSWMATIVDFAREYFSIAPGRMVPHKHEYSDRRYNETDFEDWKDLAAWVLTDISMDELVWQPSENADPFASNPFLTGLYCGMEHLRGKYMSTSNMRLNKRRLTKTMSSWLEDVQASGIDLAEYGRRQLEIHKASHRNFDRWQKLSMLQPGDDSRLYGPRLMSFTFGPRTQDWNLIWDLDVEGLTGDFWELIENPPLHIPGAYPEHG
ncbi:hypothetical protein GCG54_00003693 [Colletotrichum gloeosporioides]|uniref:Fungal N-terminal domain-containing protein n=1 Tax=Colletotrichum gloeosporioides TaxID=474922 RepID=A0A8H4CXG8_COLGL|nr:uncharacterized protein GCG54_00003693 [Colletotrichum gloeosporioides]KAF3811944.1 hypothetical protein GCG54_00003693 [Colletotrichum gloeosporioides]